MVGIARRLKHGSVKNLKDVATAYESLLKDEKYISAVKTGTADEPNVALRLDKATKSFQKIR
jgi:hypothetical protein